MSPRSCATRRWPTRRWSCSPTATTWTTSCSMRYSRRPARCRRRRCRQRPASTFASSWGRSVGRDRLLHDAEVRTDEVRPGGGPSLSDADRAPNIVVIADEAHRTQYDLIDGLARNLRDALPNAAFIGFTGTPIEAADRNTRAIFGEYIDVYDLTQAVEDEATVSVYYEARLAKVELPEDVRARVDQEFEEVTERAEDETRERLKTRWARVEAIVGAQPRIPNGR